MTASLRIEIFPADVDRSVAYYERLGFELRGRHDGPPPYASLTLGDVRLGVCEAEAVDPAHRAVPSGAEIVVEVDDVEATRDAVVAAGVDLSADLTSRPWGLTDFRVTDPDGYYWRFTSRG